MMKAPVNMLTDEELQIRRTALETKMTQERALTQSEAVYLDSIVNEQNSRRGIIHVNETVLRVV